jgi:hypothetical protein
MSHTPLPPLELPPLDPPPLEELDPAHAFVPPELDEEPEPPPEPDEEPEPPLELPDPDLDPPASASFDV